MESPVNELLEELVGSPEAPVEVVDMISGPEVLGIPVDEVLRDTEEDPMEVEERPL